MTGDVHTPVLVDESVKYLIKNKSGKYFEGTAGFGGHTEQILKSLTRKGEIIATDVDKTAFEYSKNKFAQDDRVKLYNFNFSYVDVIAKIESLEFFEGIFADLGVSSYQLDFSAAGFTYSTNTYLDLRLNKLLNKTAADFINELSEKEIAQIIYEFGEEKNSRKIAKKICEFRSGKKIEYTGELRQIISELTPEKYLTKTLSRVFQAFRIYVNDELEVLKQFLTNSIKVLSKGGRLVLISYHSLEDRIIKEFFRYESLKCICPKSAPVCTCGKIPSLKILTRKPVVPSSQEIKNNKRSRSAKLRAAEKL
jgi:16S rRNA (cytosine1402-N4)-methyltransferase